ncbi:HAD-IIIC family phosphatase [Nitrosopumilus sp.]|uniref:HAD-IIIC family phosphatase n=1 Tax=Nitrosopumilus sp. TaxID=2024843 RepID=UPI003D098822
MELKKLSDYMNEAKIIKPKAEYKKIRVAFLGSFSLNGFEETIQVQSNEEKINCITYNAPYNQYNQEILNNNSDLYKFNPELIFLLIDTRTILGDFFYSSYEYSDKERKNFVNEKFLELQNLIETVIKKCQSKIVLTNFLIPTYSSLGIFDSKIEYGLKEMIIELNKKLKQISLKNNSVYLFDFNSFVAKFGEKNVLDFKKLFFGDIRISFDIIPFLIYEFMGFLKPMLGLNKKCIVLDLDNTLWGGIVGEDGLEGIKLGPDPAGSPFVEFQKMLKSLEKRGIILAVNSKNNFDDAIKVLKEHPYMILREEDFACLKINWNDKISNMKEISNELNIGLDSMIFFDDDPVNRELIKMSIPEVKTIDLTDDPAYFSSILMDLNDFNSLKITEDDFKRTNMYQQENKRHALEYSTKNLNEYLEKLNINVKVKLANKFSIPRISQLILKTNQFNLTTKRYQEEEIKKFTEDENIVVGCAEVNDKFGESGITNVFIIKKNDDEWFLDTFLLSCRIMGRGIEEGILGKIVELAKKEKVKTIKAQFVPTQKNKPAENFLYEFGFHKDGEFWLFSVKDSINIPNHLVVRFE